MGTLKTIRWRCDAVIRAYDDCARATPALARPDDAAALDELKACSRRAAELLARLEGDGRAADQAAPELEAVSLELISRCAQAVGVLRRLP